MAAGTVPKSQRDNSFRGRGGNNNSSNQNPRTQNTPDQNGQGTAAATYDFNKLNLRDGSMFVTQTIQPIGPAMSTSASSAANEWLADTAADDHISNYPRENFRDYVPLPPNCKGFSTAAGVTFAIGKGTLTLVHKRRDGSPCVVHYSEVYHLPTSPVNLISINKLRNAKKLYHDGFNQTLVDYVTRKEIGYCPGRSGCSIIQLYDVPDAVTVTGKSFATHSNRAAISLYRLHCRLGHRNYNYCLQVAEDSGYKLTNKVKIDCNVCALAKMRRRVSRTPQRRTTQPWDLVHTDTSQISTVGYNGHKYALHFVDDCTRYHFTKTYKTLHEVAQGLIDFYEHILTRFSKRIKAFRMDNGTEHGGAFFTNFCDRRGVTIETSAPHTQEQDGVSERAVGIITETARCMLLGSPLPKSLWPEAYQSATYVINHTPTRVNKDSKSPTAALAEFYPHDSLTSLDHIRTFSTPCYVHVPVGQKRAKGDKMAARAVGGYLVGYEGEHGHLYRVWIPSTRKVIRSRDVIFRNDDEVDKEVKEVGIIDLFDDEIVPDEPSSEGAIYEESVDDSHWKRTQRARKLFLPELGDSASLPEPDERFDDHENALGEPVLRQTELNNYPHSDSSSDEDEHEQESVPRHSGRTRQKPARYIDELNETAEKKRAEDTENRRLRKEAKKAAKADRAARANFTKSINCHQFGHAYSTTETIVPSAAAEQGKEEFKAAFATASNYSKDWVPRNFKEAMQSPEKEQWLAACKAEIKAQRMAESWVLEEPPTDGTPVIDGTWNFKKKFDKHGRVIKYKARWCARGDQQRPGFDVEELSSPVARAQTIKILFALVALLDLECDQVDIDTAFLNALIKNKKVYVRQPQGFKDRRKPDWVCRLLRALYGLRDSPWLWFGTLTEFLQELGFTQLQSDICIYRGQQPNTFIAIYVDDLLIIAPTRAEVDELKAKLAKKFKIKDMGPVAWFLSMKIDRNRAKRTISISQEAYIRKVLAEHPLEHPRNQRTPLAHRPVLHANKDTANPTEIKAYGHIIGQLMWPAVSTRVDIAFHASQLARYTHNPSKEHFAAAADVHAYLHNYPDLGIVLCFDGQKELGLEAYSDSDWANDVDTRRSTSGFIIKAGGGPIAWRSTRQAIVTTSSSDAEFVALNLAAKELLWTIGLLRELGYKGSDIDCPIIYGDNNNALSFCNGGQLQTKSKHMAVTQQYIRERVKNGELAVERVDTKNNIADGLTKTLTPALHAAFTRISGLQKIPYDVTT